MNLHCSRLKYTILSILWLQYHRIFIWKETYSCMFDVDFKCISNLENDQGCLSYLLTQILMILKYMKIKHRQSSKNVNVYVDILAFRKIVFELHLQILRHFDTTWSSNTICKATYNWATNQMCAEVHTTKTAVFINIHDNDTLEYWLGKWKTCFWYPHSHIYINIYIYIYIDTHKYMIHIYVDTHIYLACWKNFPLKWKQSSKNHNKFVVLNILSHIFSIPL